MAKASDGISALTRAIGILDVFTIDAPTLTVSEMARRAGRPVSSTDRAVRELTRNRLLEPVGNNRYRLGTRLWELTSNAPGPVGLREIAGPFMVELNHRTGHPVELSVIAGTDALAIECVPARGPTANATDVGNRTPLPHAAAGLALLANAPMSIRRDKFGADRPPLNGRAAQPAHDLDITLETVRKHGYAVADGPAARGTTGVAAPITGPGGHTIAALGSFVPASSKDGDGIARAVAQAAADISRSYARAYFRGMKSSRTPMNHLDPPY